MNKNVQLRTPYNHDTDILSVATSIDCDPAEDVTHQAFAQEQDINEIVRRFGIGGDLPVPKELAEFGDFSEVFDYKTAMDQLVQGQQAFDGLPAKVRARFENDPGRFWEWLQTSENVDEAVELGLLNGTLLPRSTDVPAPVSSPAGSGDSGPAE